MSALGPTLEPLRWPDGFFRPGLVATFFRDFPVFGLYARTKRTFRKMLARRDPEEHKAAWSKLLTDFDTFWTVSTLIKEMLHWPNGLFIPADPCDILLWNPGPSMVEIELMMEISEETGIPDAIVDNTSGLEYGNFIRHVYDAQSTR